jgi:hypothetical protein
MEGPLADAQLSGHRYRVLTPSAIGGNITLPMSCRTCDELFDAYKDSVTLFRDVGGIEFQHAGGHTVSKVETKIETTLCCFVA